MAIELTDNALNSLTKLKNLIKIKIFQHYKEDEEEYEYINFAFITDTGLHNLIDNCSQSKSIEFLSRTNITNKTIDQLIALALRNLIIEYDFHFSGLEQEFKLNVNNKEIVSMPIILENFELPNNLKFN
jgi:hypothetical protein